MAVVAKPLDLKTALNNLKDAIASNHGNLPSKELIVKRSLAEEIEKTPLKNIYIKIYEDCFPRGGSPNTNLLNELADGGLSSGRLPLTRNYWSEVLENDLGL